jgi:site-specific DNA recombinase
MELQAEADRHRTRLDALAAAYAGEGDPVEYKIAARKIREQIAAAEQKIADAVTASHGDDVGEDYGLGVDEYWPQQTIEQKRAILRSRFKVTVLPGRRGRPPKNAPRLDTSLIKIERAPYGTVFPPTETEA